MPFSSDGFMEDESEREGVESAREEGVRDPKTCCCELRHGEVLLAAENVTRVL